MIQSAYETWLPQNFVAQSSGLDFGEFSSTYGPDEYLLVRHDTAAGVRAALEQTCALCRDSYQPQVLMDSVGPSVTAIVDEPDGVFPEETRSVQQIARRLASWELFIVPIAKRIENGFPEKVSVGRTANNDIVLRHGTVSSFHGWFSRDSEGHLYVRDGGSKNGTMQNGAPLVGPARVRSGDTIRFGRVEAMVCSPEAIWSLLASAGDSPSRSKAP